MTEPAQIAFEYNPDNYEEIDLTVGGKIAIQLGEETKKVMQGHVEEFSISVSGFQKAADSLSFDADIDFTPHINGLCTPNLSEERESEEGDDLDESMIDRPP